MKAKPFDSPLDASALLRVRSLSKRYRRREVLWGKSALVEAVIGVDFEILPGKTLALVGRSGSGKSTVARCVTRLERPDEGEIWMGGRNITRLPEAELRGLRSEMQMIFQDAATSMNPGFTAMNPGFTATEVIEEPLLIQGWGNRRECRERALALMSEVGISPSWADRLITDFSGGQQQRMAIARALAVQPKLLVLDEALSGLDVSTQAQVANLLLELQASHSLTYLLVSHDLPLVARLADTIAIMAAGEIVEQGPTQQIIATPRHSATEELLESARALEASFAARAGDGS